MCNGDTASHIVVTARLLAARDRPFDAPDICLDAVFTPLAYVMHALMCTGLTGQQAFDFVVSKNTDLAERLHCMPYNLTYTDWHTHAPINRRLVLDLKEKAVHPT